MPRRARAVDRHPDGSGDPGQCPDVWAIYWLSPFRSGARDCDHKGGENLSATAGVPGDGGADSFPWMVEVADNGGLPGLEVPAHGLDPLGMVGGEVFGLAGILL